MAPGLFGCSGGLERVRSAELIRCVDASHLAKAVRWIGGFEWYRRDAHTVEVGRERWKECDLGFHANGKAVELSKMTEV